MSEKRRGTHLGRGNLSANSVGGEEGEGHEGSGADGEALADGGSGVAGSVESVGALADVGTCAACERSCLVANGGGVPWWNISAIPPALSLMGP